MASNVVLDDQGVVISVVSQQLTLPPGGDAVVVQTTQQNLQLGSLAVAGSSALTKLGSPPDGTFADGLVPLTPNTTVTEAIDAINEAMAQMQEPIVIKLGQPTDASWEDGLVTGWSPDTGVVDAIDDLNEAALGVKNLAGAANSAALQALANADSAANQADIARDTADGAITIAQSAGAQASAAAAAAAEATALAQTASGQAQQASLTAEEATTDATGAMAVATDAQVAADAAASSAQTALTTAADAADAAGIAQTTASMALTSAQTAQTSATNAATAAQTAHALADHAADAAQAAQTTAMTAIDDASAAHDAADDASAAAASATSAASDAQAAAGSANATALAAQTTAASAQSAANTASSAAAAAQADATLALSPGVRALGTPSDGSWADGLAAIGNTTTIVDGVDALNEGLLGLKLGQHTFSNLPVQASGLVSFTGRGGLSSAGDGDFQFLNSANAAAGLTLGSLKAGNLLLGVAGPSSLSNGGSGSLLQLGNIASDAVGWATPSYATCDPGYTINIRNPVTPTDLLALQYAGSTKHSFGSAGNYSAASMTLTGTASAATLAATNSATVAGKAVYTNRSAIGANDQDAQLGGSFYRVWDFQDSPAALYGPLISGANNSALGGIAGPRNDDSNTVNSYHPTSAHHPGCIGVFTQSVGYANMHVQALYAFAPDQGVTTIFRILFRPPAAASNATNDYSFYVGVGSVGASAVLPWVRGWFIKYRHSLNGGAWSIGAINTANEGESTAASAVAFTAGAWHTLTITMPPTGGSISYTLTSAGVTSSLGNITNANMHAPTNQAASNVCGIALVRHATDGTSFRAGYIDRLSMYSTGMSGLGG